MLSYDVTNQSVTVTNSNGRTIIAALEDTRLSVSDEIDLAQIIQQAIDEHAADFVCNSAADFYIETTALVIRAPESDDDDFDGTGDPSPSPPDT